MAKLALENAFWKFSVAIYGAPGVAEECLALQESYGVDVNVLLFCAWLGWSSKIKLTPNDIELVEVAVESWHAGAVKPLRAVRRFLKAMPETEIGELRARIKTIELDSERVEQAMLYAYAEERWPPTANAHGPIIAASNLDAFLTAHGYRWRGADDAPLMRLSEAILALDAKR